jgi:hypothetical protein
VKVEMDTFLETGIMSPGNKKKKMSELFSHFLVYLRNINANGKILIQANQKLRKTFIFLTNNELVVRLRKRGSSETGIFKLPL